MKTTKVNAPPVSTPNSRKRSTGSSVEVLESRIAPAVTAAGFFSFTDSDGDLVKVQISGKFTSVTFKDSLGAEVTDGHDIATIEIDKPMLDFTMVFADANPGPGLSNGNNEIELGKISGPAGARLPIINKIATVDSETGVAFHLDGFIGTDFSAGGGLKIHGDLTGSSLNHSGLDLLNVVSTATVSLRDGVALGATATIANNVAGTFFVGPVDGTVTLKTVTGSAQFGDLSGKITLLKDLTGRIGVGDTAVDINGDPTGVLELKGSSLAAARIIGGADLNLKVGVNAGGLIQSTGNLTLNVGKSIVGATVISGKDLDLHVTENVQKSSIFAQGKLVTGSKITKDVTGSAIVSGQDMDLEIGKGLTSSRVDTGGFGTLLVTGAIATSKISAASDLTVTGGKGIAGSEIAPDGNLTIGVAGDITKSVLSAKDSTLDVTGAGKLTGSELFAATELTLNLTSPKSDISASKLTSGSLMTVNGGGKLSSTRLISGDNLSSTIVGAISTSQFLPGNDLDVTANSSVAGSRFETLDGNIDLTVIGSMMNTVIDSGADVSLDLRKSIPNTVKVTAALNVDVTASGDLGAAIVASDSVKVTTPGNFIGTIRTAGDVALDVGYLGQKSSALIPPPTKPGAEVAAPPVAIKTYVAAGGDFSLIAGGVNSSFVEVGGNVTGFEVAGNFNGFVRVAGNFVVGDTINPVTIIGGSTTAGSLIEIAGNIGDVDSTPKLIVEKGFYGRLTVGGKLLTDLQFNDAASRLSFEGGIGSAVTTAIGQNAIAEITVAGNLTKLSTGSLYKTIDAHNGSFVDGGGVSHGTLFVTGNIMQVLAPDFQII